MVLQPINFNFGSGAAIRPLGVSHFLFPVMDNNKGEWFSTWFDSPLYHLLYKKRDQTEANDFLDLLIERLGIQRGAKILDLGCGRGRFAKYLGSKGFDVLGIDLSKNSIQYAKRFEHSNLHFEVHDMRDSLADRKFQYVFNLFTSFGYFSTEDEDIAVLTSVRESIPHNGTLVIDFINGEKAEQNLIKEEDVKIDDLKFHITRWIENGRIYKQIEVNNQQFREEVKLLSLEQFQDYASKTGFQLTDIYGDYRLRAYNKTESDRLIMVFSTI